MAQTPGCVLIINNQNCRRYRALRRKHRSHRHDIRSPFRVRLPASFATQAPNGNDFGSAHRTSVYVLSRQSVERTAPVANVFDAESFEKSRTYNPSFAEPA